jgi:YbbR domain-containing protein
MKGLSFRQDLGLKVASLVLSLLLWLYVQYQESNKVPYSFRVDVVINPEPENLQHVSPEKPSVDVEVWGTPEVIEEFKRRRAHELIKANVDGGRAQEGEGSYGVTLFPRNELTEVEIREAPKVTLNFEEKLTLRRKVEVVPGGDPPAGFEFGAADVSPSEVEISGPKSLVLGAQVQAKISLSNIRSGATFKARVEVLDREGTPITDERLVRTPVEVEVTPSLTPAKPRRTLLVSPIYSGAPATGFHVSRVSFLPPTVMVQGDRSRMQNVSIIETEPISLGGIRSRTEREVGLKAPPGIQVMGNRKVKVVIFVEPDAPTQPVGAPPPSP